MSSTTITHGTGWEAPKNLPTSTLLDKVSTISEIGHINWAQLDPANWPFTVDARHLQYPIVARIFDPLQCGAFVVSTNTQPLEDIGSRQVKQEQESPFDHLLERSKALALNAINELVNCLDGFESCAERLRELTEMAVEEYPETRIPAVVSISTFGRFVKLYPSLKRPTISLLPSGGLWLSWSSVNVRAALGIARDGQATFGLVAKRPNQRPVHFNLSGSIEEIAPEIHSSNRSRWIWG